jgi:hypothetical protein
MHSWSILNELGSGSDPRSYSDFEPELGDWTSLKRRMKVPGDYFVKLGA